MRSSSMVTSKTSIRLISIWLPVLTKYPIPIPRERANAAMPVPKAPDCVAKATGPPIGGLSAYWLKVALNLSKPLMSPKLLGPQTRMSLARAAFRRSRSSLRPATPISPNPEEKITATGQPFSPSWVTVSIQRAAEMTTIAMSGASGSDAISG